MTRRLRIFLLALFVVGVCIGLVFALTRCGCPVSYHPNAVNYPVQNSLASAVKTPMGIKCILNGNTVDLAAVDQKFQEAFDCLKENWHLPKHISFGPSCVTIFFPDDWRTSCDGTQQIFGLAPQEACNDKGFSLDPNCPCGWRVTIIDGKIIATTPNLYMLKAGIVQYYSGYSAADAWNTPDLAKCAMP